MGFLSELRYPTRWYSKLIAAILALGFFGLLATATISGFLLFRIVSPAHTRPEINTQSFPGRPDTVTFNVPGIGPREGWFFPGLKSAPTIVVCHGYQSSRGELLTLVSTLQDHQYNVFLFDFAAHGSSPGITAFGFREVQELRAAVDTLARRNDLDSTRFGLWGYNLGAYVALQEAAGDKRIRAIVADSVYDSPAQMVKLQVERTGLGVLPMMSKFAQFAFRWLNYEYRDSPPLSRRLKQLAGVDKLFIQAVDEPFLATTTRDLFLLSPEPREQVILLHGNFPGMSEDDKRTYENRIVSFFLLRLPAAGRHVR